MSVRRKWHQTTQFLQTYEHCVRNLDANRAVSPLRRPGLQRDMFAHLTVITTFRSDTVAVLVELFYTGHDCRKIPGALCERYGEECRRLDLSFNIISSLKGLEVFTSLEELILDNNQLSDNLQLPTLPFLRTLSLNKNKINDLEGLLDKITVYLTNLCYLSLLGNPACPNQLSCSDKDDEDYHKYRLRVIYRLPNLTFLDSTKVGKREKMEALKMGAYTKVIRPALRANGEFHSAFDEDEVDSDSQYSPLPQSSSQNGGHRGAYGICRYKYLGLHSEGNRFIRNNDL